MDLAHDWYSANVAARGDCICAVSEVMTAAARYAAKRDQITVLHGYTCAVWRIAMGAQYIETG
jgi:hypothetical protein